MGNFLWVTKLMPRKAKYGELRGETEGEDHPPEMIPMTAAKENIG
jgi:hypothetical protein